MLGPNTLRFAYGEVGSRAPLLVLELTLARMLGPAVYGLWSVIQSIVTYGNFLHLGVSSSLARSEPGLIELQRFDELQKYRQATYGFQLLAVAVAALGYGITIILVPSASSDVGGLEIGFALMLAIFMQQITITSLSSALNEYSVLPASISRLIFAFSFLGLGLTASRGEYPLFWLTLSWSIALGIGFGSLIFLAPSIFAWPRIDLSTSRKLLVDGFPIMAQGLVRLGLMSIDKLLLFMLAQPEALGYYSIGTLGAGVTSIFGSMIARVSLPTLLRLSARSGQHRSLHNEFDRMIRLIQVVTFVSILSICALLPFAINLILPDYAPSIYVIALLIVTGGFIGFGTALNDISMSFGVKRRVIQNTVLTLVLEIVLITLAWVVSGTIESVALAVITAMFFLFVRAAYIAFQTMNFDSRDCWIRLVKLIVGSALFAVMCFSVLILQLLAIEKVSDSWVPVTTYNTLLFGTLAFISYKFSNQKRLGQ